MKKRGSVRFFFIFFFRRGEFLYGWSDVMTLYSSTKISKLFLQKALEFLRVRVSIRKKTVNKCKKLKLELPDW